MGSAFAKAKKTPTRVEVYYCPVKKAYFLFTSLMYFCKAIVIEGVSGVGA